MKTLWIIVPCYNEREVLPETSRRLSELTKGLIEKGKIAPGSKVVFVNDGSKDETWSIIRGLCESDSVFAGINLARNRGHQYALLAGLMTARKYADVTVSIDADLQDDISVIEEMLDKHEKGADIVYGVRSSRKTDTPFKRLSAEGFYKFMAALGVEVVFNHADYRLMSKRALDGLAEFDEYNLFLRGIIPQIGYETDTVEYERAERFAGTSKYPLKKMLALAFEGITSFSVKPIRLGVCLSGFAMLISLALLIYSVVRHFQGGTAPGWASLSVSIWFLGALQLLMIGIVGEYVGKVYLETKHRPKYIIKDIINPE